MPNHCLGQICVRGLGWGSVVFKSGFGLRLPADAGERGGQAEDCLFDEWGLKLIATKCHLLQMEVTFFSLME